MKQTNIITYEHIAVMKHISRQKVKLLQQLNDIQAQKGDTFHYLGVDSLL